MKIRRRKPELAPFIACDTETTGIDVYGNANAFAVGIADPASKEGTMYWEWEVDPETRLPNVSSADVEAISDILNRPEQSVVFHNAKFDLTILRKLGIEVQGRIEDTSFASRICNNLELSYGLKPLAYKYFSIGIEDESELQAAVLKVRGAAKRYALSIGKGKLKPGMPDTRSWSFHDDTKADYWVIQLAQELGIELPKYDYCEEYCRQDTVRTAVLWEMYQQILDSDPAFRATYENEIALLPTVMCMESRGFHISRSATQRELQKAVGDRDRLLQSLRSMARQPELNPASSQQVSKILFDKQASTVTPVVYCLTPIAVTKTGYSTAEDALRPHGENAFVRELLRFREADKSIATFYQKYLYLMRPDELSPGYPDSFAIHCSLNQCGTRTGRFSANEPNLQQASNPEVSAGSSNSHARRPFGPRPGYYLYSVDYSGQEGRIFAYYAEVKEMLKSIYAGEDFNTNNANLAWGNANPGSLEVMSIALELGSPTPSKVEVAKAWEAIGWNANRAKHGYRSLDAIGTAGDFLASYGYNIVAAETSLDKKLSRQRAKILLFVLIYGGGATAAAGQLYCSIDKARTFVKDFNRPFPEMKRFIDETSRAAAKDGFITTVYGNKLRIEPDYSYKAVNWLIQGTAAQMIKTGLRRVADYLKSTGLDAHLILTVHDEIIIEVKQEHAYRSVLREVCRLMADTGEYLTVPMPVDIKRASVSWEDKGKVRL